MTTSLINSEIQIKVVEDYDQKVFDDLVSRNLESSSVFIPQWEYSNLNEKDYVLKNKTIKIGAFHKGRLVGLSSGGACGPSRFMMNMSLVEPEFRKQGIYAAMLEKVLELTKDFDEVDSYHHIFNNSMIRLKLKYNFHIISMDHSIIIGPRIKMRYFHNQKLKDLMHYRVGLKKDIIKAQK